MIFYSMPRTSDGQRSMYRKKDLQKILTEMNEMRLQDHIIHFDNAEDLGHCPKKTFGLALLPL